jgi:Mn2+/Fe2+ NRAMP family transporter
VATSAQAGAAYGFSLLWAILIGTICLVFLIEMSGRFAIASHHTVADGIRERFGSNYFLLTLLIISIVNLLVLASEIGGVALALQFVSGIGFQWWALPVGFTVWILLWKGTFGMIEDGVAILGLALYVSWWGCLSCTRPGWRWRKGSCRRSHTRSRCITVSLP